MQPELPSGQKEHSVFVEPEVFGFTPGGTVDLLPYLFYQDPRRFDFTASVEWHYALPAFFAMRETFDLPGQATVAAYLTPIVGDPSRPVGQKGPLAWETVGLDSDLVPDAVKVRFETRQTSPTTIETLGKLSFEDVLIGIVKLNGTYRGK